MQLLRKLTFSDGNPYLPAAANLAEPALDAMRAAHPRPAGEQQSHGPGAQPRGGRSAGGAIPSRFRRMGIRGGKLSERARCALRRREVLRQRRAERIADHAFPEAMPRREEMSSRRRRPRIEPRCHRASPPAERGQRPSEEESTEEPAQVRDANAASPGAVSDFLFRLSSFFSLIFFFARTANLFRTVSSILFPPHFFFFFFKAI